MALPPFIYIYIDSSQLALPLPLNNYTMMWFYESWSAKLLTFKISDWCACTKVMLHFFAARKMGFSQLPKATPSILFLVLLSCTCFTSTGSPHYFCFLSSLSLSLNFHWFGAFCIMDGSVFLKLMHVRVSFWWDLHFMLHGAYALLNLEMRVCLWKMQHLFFEFDKEIVETSDHLLLLILLMPIILSRSMLFSLLCCYDEDIDMEQRN